MSSRRVTIVETVPVDQCRYCLIGVPDVGLVSTIALSYIIQEQQMKEVGYLESDAFPPAIVVHNGDPKPPLRLYQKGDVLAIFSEVPVDAGLITPIARSIVEWAKRKQVDLVIALSGIAVPNRLELDVPEVYGVGSSPSVKTLMTNSAVRFLEEGFVTGLHAIVIQEGVQKQVPTMILLAQAHLTYPDPAAAASLTTSLNNLLGWQVDTKELQAR
ncbi:MAG: proteasome assembly chaperone family protein, partial [Candidatus Bathyarchaeota archaeon]